VVRQAGSGADRVVRQAGSGADRVVRQAGSVSGQTRVKTRRTRKERLGKSRS
jgi:hypothetical protein